MTNIEVRDKLHYILSSKEEIFDRCIFNLLPKGFNNRKGGIVTQRVTDELELEFKIDISDVMDSSSIIVYDDILKLSGIDKEDLIDASRCNTETKLPARFDSMGDMLNIDEFDDFPMYVLSNFKQTFGAGAILYHGMYEKLYKILGDFIVIPSSVHEVIIVPEAFNNPYISKIIREVNETVVASNEILSDRPYRLTPAGDLIEI